MENLRGYNHHFYKKQLNQSKNSAEFVVPIINKLFNPKSVIDIGCGVGAWLDVWKNQSNVLEIKGIDADFIEKSLLQIDIDEEFIQADLNNRLPKLKKYDLAMCLEVAEHLNEERANTFIEDLTNLSDVVLFSAAIPGQEGTQHINEQYLSYWIEKFRNNNFKCYDVIRPLIWDVESVAWWFRQNTVLFINNNVELKIDLDSMQSFNCFDLIQKDLLMHKDRKYNNLLNRENNAQKQLKRLINKLFSSKK